jgi:hypothetical protein
MVDRICESCIAITPHKLILEAKFHECQRCHKVSRRYDLRTGRVHR